MELLLIRHALPVRLVVEPGGRADPALDPRGVCQAAALAQWLGDETLDALYSSPLRRAVETAQPLADRTVLTPTVDVDLAEWDRDAEAYIPMEELKASGHDLWLAMSEGRFDDLGIDVAGFRSRVIRAIDTIAGRHPGQRVALVCHGGVINTYTADVLGLDTMLFFEPDYTGISRVMVSRGGVRSIKSLNETGHLHEPAITTRT